MDQPQSGTPLSYQPQQPEAKKGISLTTILSLLLILSTLIAFFFYFQNTKLRKEINRVSPPVEQTPSPTSSPAANLKTYSNSKYGYSFNYPDTWEINKTLGSPPELTEEELAKQDFVSIFDPQTTKQNPYQNLSGISIEVGLFLPGSMQPVICTNEVVDTNCIEKIFSVPVPKFDKILLADKSAIKVNDDQPHLKQSVYFLIDKKVFAASLIIEGDNIYDDGAKDVFSQILATFKFINDEGTEMLVPAPELLTYTLPLNWKTVSDPTGTYEIGYDPNKYTPVLSEKRIDLNSKQGANSFFTSIQPYDEGSRHEFIYKSFQISGYEALGASDRTYEKNYTFNNKSGLYIYNISLSATASTGMLNIGGSQALLLSSTGSDEVLIESLISSIKILK